MKILQICSHYDYGGAARIAATLHRQLPAYGVESYVAFGRGEIPDEPNLFCFDKKAEIYLSAFLSRFVGLNGWWNRRATGRLLRYIEEIQPDLLHLHIIHGYYLNMPMLFDYINRRNIPCVWTFHDCHAFTGNCGYFGECRKWEKGCGHCPNLHGYPTSQFFDLTAYMWKKKKAWFTATDQKILVTPSKWLAGEVKKSFLAKYPCEVIPNGIDTTQHFYPRDKRECRRKYGFGEEEKLVLGIANSFKNPVKGVPYLLELSKELHTEARVILIGWDHSYDEKVKDLPNVVCLEAIADREKLAEYYSLADVFVLPSLAENYATVVLESQACGTPVVGFAVGGTVEQLEGKKGITVPAGDLKALAQAVREAFTPESGLLRGQELAQQIRQNNSKQDMTERYRELYGRLTG